MDRKTLVNLLQGGTDYAPGKRRLWVSRCFEITVRPDSVIELDEYEGYAEEKKSQGKRKRHKDSSREMFHVGRSVLHPKEGRVVEEVGTGWQLKN